MQILFQEIGLDYFVGILWSKVTRGAVCIYRGFHINSEKGWNKRLSYSFIKPSSHIRG
jgi:hypothetical protein